MYSSPFVDTRFPIVSESDTHHDMDRQAWWTNHPECLKRTWIEDIANPPVEGLQRWFDIKKLGTVTVFLHANPPLKRCLSLLFRPYYSHYSLLFLFYYSYCSIIQLPPLSACGT